MSARERRGGPRNEAASKSIATNATNEASVPLGGIDRAMDGANSSWWWAGAALAIQQLARQGVGFSAEHVVDLVGEPDDPHHLGAALAAAYRRGVIEPVGARIGRANRPVRVWWGCVR